MANQIINVLDNGALAAFAQTDNLDSLFAGGRTVVLTDQVRDEALRRQPDGSLRPNQLKIKAWIEANKASGLVQVKDVDVDLSSYSGFHPDSQLRGTFTEIPNNAASGEQYRVISHDSSLLNTGNQYGSVAKFARRRIIFCNDELKRQ